MNEKCAKIGVPLIRDRKITDFPEMHIGWHRNTRVKQKFIKIYLVLGLDMYYKIVVGKTANQSQRLF